MRAIRRFVAKFSNMLFRGHAELELTREVTAHLTLLQDEFESRGMTPQEASLAARRAYGGVEQAKELHRAERSFAWIEQAAQDLRHGVCGLTRNPGFTLIAVIALALGIGVNTALFTTYNAVALKPLPVADPDHVVRWARWVASHRSGDGFSYPEYMHAREHSDSFSGLVAASWVIALTSLPGSADRPSNGQLVSANYFADLGIRPFLGRGFLPAEDQAPGGNPVVVIGYPFWKRQFNSDVQVVGQTVTLNGVAFTVVGVAPEEFTGTPEAPTVLDFWAPLSMQAQLVPGQDWLNNPDQKHFQIFARLKPGADRRAAQAQTDLLIHQFATTYTEREKTTAVTLQRTAYFPQTDDIRFQALVAALMLIVGLVLFVACANVGNMLLARGAARRREISTRLALGASRGRVIRQLLTESVLLSSMGGLAGLTVSAWATKLLAISFQENAMLIGGDFSALNLSPDFRVMVYVIAVSLGAGILFGLSPALQFTKPDITMCLKDDAGALGRLSGSRLRSFLVSFQVAVSVLLLAIAGLLARGLMQSQVAEPGFRTRDIYVVAADFGDFGSDPAKATARKRRVVERLKEQPEVAGAALGNRPFSGTWTPPIIVNQPADQSRGRTLASYASDTYFETLGIALVRGRNFTPQESAGPSRLAIISESTARRFFSGGEPLGKYITLDLDFNGKLVDFEVIGIVKDVRYANLTRTDPAHVYLPTGLPGSDNHLDVLIRIPGDEQRALMAVAAAIEASDSNLGPSLHLFNLDRIAVDIQRAMSRMFAIFAAVLAGLALTLAGVGIYGVVAYVVSQRTREIGVRMAMGASSRTVWNNVIFGGLRPVISGTILGIIAAAGLSAILHQTLIFPGSMDFLYGVPFYDPATFASLILFVLGIAALASAVPARRAVRVDPAMALRYE